MSELDPCWMCGAPWAQRCQEKDERIAELESKVERMKDALTAISTALDAYGVDYCRGTAKAALEESSDE